jgi:hypothetical protein
MNSSSTSLLHEEQISPPRQIRTTQIIDSIQATTERTPACVRSSSCLQIDVLDELSQEKFHHRQQKLVA